ncbi:sulfotransferase family protein [Nocardioides coralli]|uniref:sulfotransferase family protein n=1 Tax=Nocardioides coralli TaxID=2872154 RepID=UPI001CA44DC8|nr:sulfotransferase [Nocardioides coralli]QZY29805.1 sulfotransferase [Nocardioides coralli]
MTDRTVPTFAVIGAARCGTTGLVEGLRTHPEVFVTEPKEPHYFALHRTGAQFTAPGDDHTINRVAVTDREAYLDLYPRQHDYRALGDASVSSLYYHEEALPEILRMNPEMKLVVMLREPVARAWSSHQYMRARGLEPVEDFLDAVSLEEERRRLGWHHIWHFTAMSRYADALEAVHAAVPREQVGVWFHDDLEADYVGTVGSILRFLGVPHHDGEGTGVPRVNVSGQPRFAAVHQAIGWATGHERIRTFVKEHTSYRFRERVRRAVLQSDPVPAEVRDALAPLFVEDLQRVRALLPGPVPAWLQHQEAPA